MGGSGVPVRPDDPRRDDDAVDPVVDVDRVVWQLAVDAAGVGAWDWDLLTGELRWDDRLLAIFGVSQQEFGGTIEAFGDFVHPDDRPKVNHALDESIRTLGEYAAEYRVIRPDGEVRWVRARGRTLAGEDGRAARLVGAAYDTTTEQEGETRVARILETMPSAFFHLDHGWRFTYVNAEAIRLLSGVTADLVGGGIWELFPDAVGSDFERHYRHAMDSGEPVRFEAYYPPPLDTWYEVRAWPGPDGLSVYFTDIDERRRAADVVQEEGRRTSLLADVSGVLIQTLDRNEAVGHLAQVVVPTLGDWCIVTLADPGPEGRETDWRRRLRDVGRRHADPDRRDDLDRYCLLRLDALSDDSYLATALRTGEMQVMASDAAEQITSVLAPGEASDLLRRLDPGSAAITPLTARGRTLGLLSVYRDRGRPAFSAATLDVLADVAERVGLALDNARLYADQRDLAEVLQRSMLTAPPQDDRVEVAVRYVPAAEAAQVGGDWYDAFLQDAGVTMVAIGDVVGHDTEAAAAMSQVRSLLRGIAAHTGDGPADVLRGVDRAVTRLQLDTTATAVVARFEQGEEERAAGVMTVRWSNAGHPPPMIVVTPAGEGEERDWRLGTRPDDAVDALWSDRSDLLLGLDPDTPRSETVVTLAAGATVWLYTDGLVERRGQALDEGLAKLREVLDELAAEDLDLEESCEALLARMLPERPEDDVALVAVRLRAPEG